MFLEPFEEIVYDADDREWREHVRLPGFAGYGREEPSASLPEPDDNFRQSSSPLRGTFWGDRTAIDCV